jgi:hypothetical protein
MVLLDIFFYTTKQTRIKFCIYEPKKYTQKKYAEEEGASIIGCYSLSILFFGVILWDW